MSVGVIMKKKDFIDMMVKYKISEIKYNLSGIMETPHGIILFCPVTVPHAVDHCLINAQQTQTEKYEGMLQDSDFISGKLRLDLIWGYFSYNAQEPVIYRQHCYESPEKTSRLEGELKRFSADTQGKDPREIVVNPYLINRYCFRTITHPLEEKILKACGFRTDLKFKS